MESLINSGLRWRKLKGLKPIQTKIINGKTEEEEDAQRDATTKEAVAPEEEPLSPSARLFNEPNFNVHVLAIMGGPAQIDPPIVKEKLALGILKHPRFCSLQVVDGKTGEMKWVRTEVDLDKHVVVPEINPNNIESSSPDKFVEDYIYSLSKTSLDKSKPLWELHLLNIKTSDSQGLGIFRIHHSLGDGTSLMSLLLAGTRQVANPDQVPTIPVKKRRDVNNNKSDSSRRVWNVLEGLWFLLEMIWNTMVDVVMFGATALFLKDTETPIKAPIGSEFNPRRIVYRHVSLDDLKLVKNILNMTINDVALGVTQAGLSRYLNRRYAEGKEDLGATEKKNNLPKNIRLRSTLLVNLRPTAGIQALADMMEKNTEAKWGWGNWIGFVLLPFTIGLRDDPLDYVRQAKSTIDRKKRSLEAFYTFSISGFVFKFFGTKTASNLSHKIITNTTMCFSNLVGPQEEIGIYGHPVDYLAASSYGQPHGLVIYFQSYANKITMVLSVDESVIPDPHKLLDDLEESLGLIKDASLNTSNQPH